MAPEVTIPPIIPFVVSKILVYLEWLCEFIVVRRVYGNCSVVMLHLGVAFFFC